MFSPTTPSFFKILVSETLQSNKLWIPRKFVRLYGNTLSDEVVLKLPCGFEWKLGVKKLGSSEMCFESGWSKFVEFYSLKYGSFIVFRYNGNSKLEAFIFDTSTVEIDYPTKTGPESPPEKPKETRNLHCSKRKRIEEAENSDDDLQILDDSSEHQKAKEVSLEKRRKTSPVDADKVKKRTLESPVRRDIVSKNAKSKTKEKPIMGKSKDSNFVIVMRPSYIKMCHPEIPNNFNVAYLSKDHGVLSLLVSNGRSWSVHYKVRMKRKVSRVAEMARGWVEFVRGNNLNVGDICKFELITSKSPLLFKVFITRVSKKACKDQPSRDMVRARRAYSIHENSYVVNRKASESSSTNPYFKVVMKPSYVEKGLLHIPLAFSTSYLKLKNKTLVLQVGKRHWSVSLYFYRSNCIITGGWLKFVREQSLCVGDICKFELIKTGTKVVMKVFAYHKNSLPQKESFNDVK